MDILEMPVHYNLIYRGKDFKVNCINGHWLLKTEPTSTTPYGVATTGTSPYGVATTGTTPYGVATPGSNCLSEGITLTAGILLISICLLTHWYYCKVYYIFHQTMLTEHPFWVSFICIDIFICSSSNNSHFWMGTFVTLPLDWGIDQYCGLDVHVTASGTLAQPSAIHLLAIFINANAWEQVPAVPAVHW